MTEILRQLKMNAKILKHQIGTGQCGQEQTQEYMEGLIQAIRNKKNRGRGESAGEGMAPSGHRRTFDRRASGVKFNFGKNNPVEIITENGPHRSRFEQQD